MVKLVKNMVNRVPVKVVSSLDYSGFSAKLEVAGLTKTIDALKSANAKMEFSVADVNAIGDSAFGEMTIYDKDGKEYIKMLPKITVVESEGAAQGFQCFRVVLVSVYEPASSGGHPSGDFVRHSDFAGMEGSKPSIISNQETLNAVISKLKG